MRQTAWTPAMDDLLEADYPRYGARYVANVLGLQPKSVANRAYVLGIKSAKTKRHELEDCHAMLVEFCSMTMKQIGDRRGLSKSQVQSCIRRAMKRA